MGQAIVWFLHGAIAYFAKRDSLFLLLPFKRNFCWADISLSSSSLAICLQEGVEGCLVGTPMVAAVLAATVSRSYGAVANWREVLVLLPYRREGKEGDRSNSAGGTGEFFSCGPESAAAPNLIRHGKLTHFPRPELNQTIV